MSNTIADNWGKVGASSGGLVYTCTMKWNQPADDNNHDEICSPYFNWKVDSDFTIFVNYNVVDTSTSATVDLHIYGSMNGYNKVDMVTATTISNADFDGKMYKYLYDTSTNGIAPLMYVALDPSADLGAVDIKVAVYPNIRRAD